jgi:hypothetical protein
MSNVRSRNRRRMTVTTVLALVATLALVGEFGGIGSPRGGVVPAAQAADGPGEIGLFQFGYDDGGTWRLPLVDGDPKGATMQGTVARQAVFWSCVEPSRDDWTIDQCRQVRVIDKLQGAGWRVQVVLRTKRGDFGKAPFWATSAEGKPDDAAVSHAPVDLRGSPSPEFGYSESYYAFVRRLLEHFCDGAACRIHSLVIENEANASEKWTGRDGTPQGDVDDYVRLVATARKALDDSGARLSLYDSGLQGSAILWNVLEEDMKSEGAAGAATAYRKAFNESSPADQVDKKIRQSAGKPTNEKIRMMLDSDLYRYTDGINFHQYQTPESIRDVVAYLRQHGPSGHPVMTNEIGIKEAVIKDKDPELVNAWMIQKFVYLFEARVSPVIWFTVPANNIGSFTTKQNKFKQASADAYNAFASRVGTGVADVKVETTTAGGRELVRARLRGSAGPFAVEWFADRAAGDWSGVAGPAGCDAGAAPYRTPYLRILDCR